MSGHYTNIKSDAFTFRGCTMTGSEYAHLIIASADDGNLFYRFLFTEDGEHAVNHPLTKEVSRFFEFDFRPARLNDEPCLVNIELLKNKQS